MRISKGKPVFGRKDTIDFSTLGEIIHAWLVKFKDDYVELELSGVPVGHTREEYREIIDKMIYAFADVEPEYAGDISCVSELIEGSQFLKMDVQVSDEDAWDQYMKDCDEHQRKVQEGLELFGEYYRSLWV